MGFKLAQLGKYSMRMELTTEMSLLDALEIVKEVTQETITHENIKVENTEQEQEAINQVEKLINLLNNDDSIRRNLYDLINKD